VRPMKFCCVILRGSAGITISAGLDGEKFWRDSGRWKGDVLISTNTIEGYFSILKRGINGVYHHVGKQHLHGYLNEF
jgi:hypothetical protein